MNGDYTPGAVDYSKLPITRHLLSGILTALFLAAQTLTDEVRIRSAIYSPPGLTLGVQANLVELAVMVRDAKERAVGGLRKEDFEVFDQGVRQTVSVFAANSAPDPAAAAESAAPPRYLALFFDDTRAGVVPLQNARNAATQFVASAMRPRDHVGIFTTSGAETLDFTQDRQTLTAALARLRPHSAGVTAVSVCPPLSEYEAYAIARSLDASIKNEAVNRAIACNCPTGDPQCVASQPSVVQNVAEMLWEHFRVPSAVSLQVLDLVIRHLARAPGNRVLLMLSPGLILDRMEKQTSAMVDAALRAQIVIHGIDASGLQASRVAGGRQIVLEQLMSNLASSTGGRLFHNNNDILGEMRTATAVPESSYLLGFSPTREPDDTYHTLKVRLTGRANLRTEARRGYFAASIQRESIQQRLDRIAASQERLDEFPATVRATPGEEQNGRFAIRVEIQVDARALTFSAQDGRSVQELTFVTVLEDASGAYITGRQAVMDLALTPVKLAELKRDGIKAGLIFYAPKGRYRIREVVREAAQNRIAASVTGVEIR